ncbi:hypothetical protein LZC95_23570 [Pendulispora brunnea]|uniref:Zinc-finger domain-containing protein n=1 Tax=Pendulispora brunnea TaxID=2905690 RepID=A0ABZ2KM86_9BACT
MPDETEHPSALALESVASGEDMPEVRAHLERCDACRLHVDALAGAMKATSSGAEYVAKLRRPRRKPLRLAFIAAPLALAAGLVLLLRGPAQEDRLKGGVAFSIIRDREGGQERISGRCRVRAGDRLLLEFATPERRTLEAGILTTKGEWLPMQPPADVDPGTHLSPSSVRVDREGLEGRALVGTPGDIAHARAHEPSAAASIVLERDPAP